MSRKFALLEEERPIIETMAYNDKYKKILDEVWKDKVELDGMIVKEEEEALEREDMKKVDRGITMIDHTQAEAMGMLINILCQIKRNKFGAPIYGPKPAPYLNCNNPDERLIAIKPLKEHTMMRQDHQDLNTHDNMKPWKSYCIHKFTMSFFYGKDVAEMKSLEIEDMLRIRLRQAGSDDEIFISFDEVCADDELQSKKIIKFRLGGRAHNLTLLEFARRLGLYQAVELEEEGFNVYFEGGLRNDDHFNAQDYWMTGYDKIQKNDLWLLSMFDARHQNGYANVAWVIARWMKRKGAGTQKESQICCEDLDTITLTDLIDAEGNLIPEDPQPVYLELVILTSEASCRIV
ncbi:hypothetical protein Tco_0817234 [Tanacetum coccineum]